MDLARVRIPLLGRLAGRAKRHGHIDGAVLHVGDKVDVGRGQGAMNIGQAVVVPQSRADVINAHVGRNVAPAAFYERVKDARAQVERSVR